jgi:uncharacterized membrane protein YfcA
MWESIVDYLWLCLAAFFAGGINALAGGGTLLTFPALKEVLARDYEALAGVFANGTSTVALVPASIGSSWGYRRELADFRRLLVWLTPPSIIGGGIGAWLVIQFPRQFNGLIPWLILVAAVLFTLQPLVSRWLTRAQIASHGLNNPALISPASLAGIAMLQLGIAIYGGYFGAGIGILMLSGLGMIGLSNMHQMNGIKVVLAAIINGVAVVIFLCDGNVVWRYALAMMATSLIGGFLAAHYSRRIKGQYVRWFVILVGFLLAAWYFLKP